MNIVRGCGTRVRRGVYAEVQKSEDGMPVEFFVVDPPVIIEPEKMGLTPIGQVLWDRGDSTHVLDWVGSSHYPNPVDFIEEGRRFGFSIRLELTAAEYARLTPGVNGSRILCVHNRGSVADGEPFFVDRPGLRSLGYGFDRCPKEVVNQIPKFHISTYAEIDQAIDDGIIDHFPRCAGLLWESVTQGEKVDFENAQDRRVIREMPSFKYRAFEKPVSNNIDFFPAIFLSLPMNRIVIIDDPENPQAVEEKRRRLDGYPGPVEIVSE